MNSRERRVQRAFQGPTRPGVLRVPLPHERSSQPHERTGTRGTQRQEKGRTLLLIGLPRTRANKEEGATTVEEELTGHRTLRTTICEAWRGRPLPPPVGYYVRCANYSWRASTHGFLQKMATWHI